jgi:hypothetical protein
MLRKLIGSDGGVITTETIADENSLVATALDYFITYAMEKLSSLLDIHQPFRAFNFSYRSSSVCEVQFDIPIAEILFWFGHLES